MREITAKSYRNKFWLKIILRSIGYGFLSSFILGIIDNFITIAVINKFLSLVATLYGVKFIYLDGMKKLNQKYTLNEFEFQSLEQKLGSLLIILGILSFIFSLVLNSLGYIITLIFTSMMGFNIGLGALLTASGIFIFILNVVINVIYSVLVVTTVKHNFNNIFNNQKISLTTLMIILGVAYLVLNLVVSFMNGSFEPEETSSDFDFDTNTDSSITMDWSTTPSTEDEEEKTVNYKESYLGFNDDIFIFDDDSIYHADFMNENTFKFNNFNFENGEKIYENDNNNLNNAVFLSDTEENVYFYHEKSDATQTGLYRLNFKDQKITQLTNKLENYNLTGNSVDYFDYILRDGTTYSIRKFEYATESTSTIYTFMVPAGSSYQVQPYEDYYITYITNNQDSSIFYKNDVEICRIDAPIDYWMVSKGAIHFFVANTVYSFDINQGQIINTMQCPFETKGYYPDQFIYDADLTNFDKLIRTSTKTYRFDSTNYTFEEVETTSDFFPAHEYYISKFGDNFILAYSDSGLFHIYNKDTLEVVKSHKEFEVQNICLGKDDTFYVVDEDFNITKITPSDLSGSIVTDTNLVNTDLSNTN